MSNILHKFSELEQEIIDANEYQRCKDYCPGCVQCDFWKKFDYLKQKFVSQESDEVEE